MMTESFFRLESVLAIISVVIITLGVVGLIIILTDIINDAYGKIYEKRVIIIGTLVLGCNMNQTKCVVIATNSTTVDIPEPNPCLHIKTCSNL